MSVVVGCASAILILTIFWFQREDDIGKLLDVLKSKVDAVPIESNE